MTRSNQLRDQSPELQPRTQEKKRLLRNRSQVHRQHLRHKNYMRQRVTRNFLLNLSIRLMEDRHQNQLAPSNLLLR
ncbi:MAG: hypothetical protein A2V62_05295 [Nitrospirae bacterium RBG_19FT_COMBO_58_9]|nr:MAG: hypothetical protein A2V62_05295 [Nitrospirae bacterium RBG_19FT_COMBO_58_9]